MAELKICDDGHDQIAWIHDWRVRQETCPVCKAIAELQEKLDKVEGERDDAERRAEALGAELADCGNEVEGLRLRCSDLEQKLANAGQKEER